MIMLVLLAFVLVPIVLPSAWLMAQELDREAGPLGNLLAVLHPLAIAFLAIFTSYQALVNTVRALSEQPIHYPLSIPFVK